MVIPKLNAVNPKSRSQVRSKIKVTQSVYWLTSFHFTLILQSFLRYYCFKIWPWKSKVKIMGKIKIQGQITAPTSYRVFRVNQPDNSWNIVILQLDLESARTRSGVRFQFKVTWWVQLSIDSHPFHSKLISLTIPKILLFQNTTLKVQGQGHGWGQISRSYSESNILSTHWPHSFRSRLFSPPIPEIQQFCESTLKIEGQGNESD